MRAVDDRETGLGDGFREQGPTGGLQRLDLDAAVADVMARTDRTIAPDDSMYGGSTEHYFGVAADAARLVLGATLNLTRPPRRVLDFGCGYGRVLRVLRTAFGDDAEIVACDLDPAAVAACVRLFGAVPMAGAVDLADIEQARDVDVLWCGSVLTHLDRSQWGPLLRYVDRALAPGGVAVLTTHGRRMAWRLEHVTDYGLGEQARATVLASYRACGFGYNDYPGQDGYGISLSSPGWVLDAVRDVPGLRVTGFVEAGWDLHQDALVVTKDGSDVVKARR